MRLTAATAACALPAPALEPPPFDVPVQGGTVHDGSGGPPRRADAGVLPGRALWDPARTVRD